MGLLDKWTKKKTKETLAQTGEKAVVKEEEKVVAKTKKAKTAASDKKVKGEKLAYWVLRAPLVTEKAAVSESLNKYSFLVAKKASKNQIKAAVLEVYGVKPATVNVMNIDGRQVRFSKGYGRRSDYKKAIVTLPEGKTIVIHEGV